VISKGALAARGLRGLMGLLLGALIIRDGVVNWMVETPSDAVLSLGRGDGRIWANAADQALDQAKTPRDLERASALAARALAADPTQVTPLRDLGLIAARRGEAATAMALMSLAGRRSPLDGRTHLWLMIHRLAAGDYAGAFADADDLLRHAPNLTPILNPLLAAYAAPGRAALQARLATNPPWRSSFLIALAAQAPDPAVTQALLGALQETAAAPTPEEWSAYFARRVKDQAYELAYLDWLKTLPRSALAQAKSIYDGDFRGMPGAPPFNWRLGGGLGGGADLDHSAAPAGGGLHARYDGYGAPELAEQLLVLAPGAYRFSGEARASGDASRALRWTLFCANPSGEVLAQVPAPDGSGASRRFSADVHVPDTGCPAQWLRLTPSPTDHIRPLEVWYRGLAMDRTG
jgi:tetratricopeptide (TPR) repeat protein